MFNIIEKETKDRIILADSDENIITASFSIIFGLVVFCFFFKGFFNANYDFNNVSENDIYINILMVGGGMVFGGFFIWNGFKCLLFKTKATIDKNHNKVIVERKSSIKCLEFIKEIYLSDIKYIEIFHSTDVEIPDSWSIRFFINTGKLDFYSSNNESETKELTDKICRLINPQIPLRTLPD